MSTTILRVLFALVFATTGFLLGREAFTHLISLHVANQVWLIVLTIAVPVLGAVAGVFVAPLAQSVFELELGEMESLLEGLSPAEMGGGVLGLIVGLLVAWLIKSVLFELITAGGKTASYVAILGSILIAVFTAYLGARVGAKLRLGSLVRSAEQQTSAAMPASAATGVAGVPKLIDTSIIIDGRIVDIVQCGFLEGPIVVPRFVLRELQSIADSSDGQRRMRGRRGLEILAKLQELVPLEIDERDYDDAGGVDAKLLRLARERHAKLVTNDFNLNRVARVESVAVLSVNDLAAAVKSIALPGEELHVTLIREGKEPTQGVAYLDDGTMIVVDNARRLIGEEVDVQVTSILQTAAGRMIFAKLKKAS